MFRVVKRRSTSTFFPLQGVTSVKGQRSGEVRGRGDYVQMEGEGTSRGYQRPHPVTLCLPRPPLVNGRGQKVGDTLRSRGGRVFVYLEEMIRVYLCTMDVPSLGWYARMVVTSNGVPGPLHNFTWKD